MLDDFIAMLQRVFRLTPSGSLYSPILEFWRRRSLFLRRRRDELEIN